MHLHRQREVWNSYEKNTSWTSRQLANSNRLGELATTCREFSPISKFFGDKNVALPWHQQKKSKTTKFQTIYVKISTHTGSFACLATHLRWCCILQSSLNSVTAATADSVPRMNVFGNPTLGRSWCVSQNRTSFMQSWDPMARARARGPLLLNAARLGEFFESALQL